MIRRLLLGAWIAVVPLGGCAEDAPELAGTDQATRVESPAAAPPVQVIQGTYLARPDSEDWIEEIDRAAAGSQFLIYIEPQLRSPAEGPWALTLAREGDARFVRIPDLHVDHATGRLTFLLQRDAMLPGDYLVLLTLEEGGRATGPEQQGFRFRIR